MTVISNDGRFEWDSGKNELNKKKHLLSFEEILEVLMIQPFWKLLILSIP